MGNPNLKAIVEVILADEESAKGVLSEETLNDLPGIELKSELAKPENFAELTQLLVNCKGMTRILVAQAIKESGLLDELRLPPEKWFELIQNADIIVSRAIARKLTYIDDDFSLFKTYLFENPLQFTSIVHLLPSEFFSQLFYDKNFSEQFFAQYDAKTFCKIPVQLLKFFGGEPSCFGLQDQMERLNPSERETIAETALQEAKTSQQSLEAFFPLYAMLNKYVRNDHPVHALIDPTGIMREILASATEQPEENKKQQAAIVLINRANIPRSRKDELIARITTPFVMNQEQNSLCGPITFWMQLAEVDPVRYAEIATKLLTERKITISNPASRMKLQLENKYPVEKMKLRSIDMMMSSALRRASNRSGLYASSQSVPSKVEALMGYTPRRIL